MTLEHEKAIARLDFKPDDSQRYSYSDARQIVYWQAFTSPHNHGEFIEAVFNSAFYPENVAKSGLVENLNNKFLEDWYELRQKWGSQERSHSALSSLYFFTRDFVAPIRLLFALDALKAAAETSSQVHFMARDAYPEFVIATHLNRNRLVEKVPDFNYVPLSVQLMRQIHDVDKKPSLEKYLKQFSFGNGGKHQIVDIGFTGEIPHLLSEAFPDDEYSIHFLMNEADEKIVKKRPVMENAKGYIYDVNKPDRQGMFPGQMTRIFRRVMEDTFSGLSTSSTELKIGSESIRTNAKRYPQNYNTLRRELALRGVRDSLKLWTIPMSDGCQSLSSEEIRIKLVSNFKQCVLFFDNFLNSDQIFVPHEPTNF